MGFDCCVMGHVLLLPPLVNGSSVAPTPKPVIVFSFGAGCRSQRWDFCLAVCLPTAALIDNTGIAVVGCLCLTDRWLSMRDFVSFCSCDGSHQDVTRLLVSRAS